MFKFYEEKMLDKAMMIKCNSGANDKKYVKQTGRCTEFA